MQQPAATGPRQNIPNALTILRLALAATVVALLADADPVGVAVGPRTDLLTAATLFAIAAATDALDGFLARRWNAVTILGRVMDPLADKLLVLGTLVMLAGPAFAAGPAGAPAAGFTGWMVVVILGRELLVTSIRGAFEARGVDFSASLSGKLKMIMQSLVIPACLLAVAIWPIEQPRGIAWAIAAAAWATTLVTAWSAVPYLMRAVRASSEAGAGDVDAEAPG
ncbi:MAG: CDP-alcohol phosphatidyltransferase family protein [Planctomycetota bacterium]